MICLWMVLFLLWGTIPGALAAAPPQTKNYVNYNGSWTNRCDAMPGEEISCLAVFTARGGESCIARGKLSPGLEYVGTTALRQNGEPVNASYCTVVTRWLDSNSAFEIHFSPLFARDREVRLEIEYTVRLTTDAGPGERSTAAVELVDSREGVTSGEAAVIQSFGFSLYRGVSIPDTENHSNPLPSVCFSLYGDQNGKTRIAFLENGNKEYCACTAADCGHTRHAYLLSTPENGVIQLRGLSEGTYYLREERTPQGYKSTADMLEITVSENGQVSAGGVPLLGQSLSLLEQSASAHTKTVVKDLMWFYEMGCKVLATALAVLLAMRRYLFC